MGTRRCGLLDVKDVELGQLPMVTETRERSSPVDTAGQLRHWRERDTCSVDSRQLGRFAPKPSAIFMCVVWIVAHSQGIWKFEHVHSEVQADAN